MPQYPHTTFPTQITNADGSVTVATIPNPGLTEEEKAVIQLALDGEDLFKNSLEEIVISSSSSIQIIISRLIFLNSITFSGDPPSPSVNYPPLTNKLDNLIDAVERLYEQMIGTPPSGANFLNHIRRISGSSGGSLYDQPDGELYGFGALQGIASAYNGAREAMRAENEPVQDHYSKHFSSILNAGSSLVSDVDSAFYVELVPPGVYDYKINGISLSWGYRGDPEAIEFDEGDIQPTTNLINSFVSGASNLISSDNSALSYSVDYLKKYALGSSVLGMGKDTFFGRRLLDVIKSEELSEKLDDI